MEVAVSLPSMDLNYDSGCSSPFISAPSSPKQLSEFYFSAPTSPTRLSGFYRDFNDLSMINDSSSNNGGSYSVIPFNWEEIPGKPKPRDTHNNEGDFAFDFSGQLERSSLSADELFDGGKIRPLKPPPRLQLGSGLNDDSATRKNSVSSPKSPKSPISQGKKMFREAFSPKHRKNYFDPFEAAIEQTRKGVEHERGRERLSVSSSLSSNSGRRETRSLSPFRVSEPVWEEQQCTKPFSSLNSKPISSSSSSSSMKGYRRWRLKDFLLFRSASEGRATEKDPLRKYAALSKKNEDDVKNSSFRSTDTAGSRRRGPVSAHEKHYTVNRSISEQMKKKTFLPYKHGLLGCLGFNPAVHGLTRGFGAFTRG